jgi:hypothetical protein
VLLLVRIAATVGVAGLATYAALGQPAGDHVDGVFNIWLYDGLLLFATGFCLIGSLRARGERTTWLILGVAMAAWLAGDLYYSFAFADDPSPPFPSPSDAGYIAFYPAVYVALFMAFRARTDGVARVIWLDGVVSALAAAAVCAAAVFGVVLRATKGDVAAVATNLVYPLGDMIVLAAVIGVFALSGWRFDRLWLLVGAGLATSAVADSIYLVQVAHGTYVEGTLLDVMWPASMLLLAQAPWIGARRRERLRLLGRPLLVTPAVCGLIAISILLLDHFHRVNVLALGLATATLLGVLVRTALTFRENARFIARTRDLAITDALTGLGNRRRLLEDLEDTTAEVGASDSWLLVLFDLDGF